MTTGRFCTRRSVETLAPLRSSFSPNGADVNAKAKDDYTPLHAAAKEGHKAVAELLLANKADVNAKGRGGDNTFVCSGGRRPQGSGGVAARKRGRC